MSVETGGLTAQVEEAVIKTAAPHNDGMSSAMRRNLSSPWASAFVIVLTILWTIPTFGLLVTGIVVLGVLQAVVYITVGLLVGCAFMGLSVGGIFALTFAYCFGRIGDLSPRVTALVLAAAGFATIMANAKKYDAKANLQGVQVQQMVMGGQEVIIGAVTDQSFGKLVAFGLGGILVEVLKDITFRLAPTGAAEAMSMVEGIAGLANLLPTSVLVRFARQQVEIVASMPCYLEDNVDRQRGKRAHRVDDQLLATPGTHLCDALKVVQDDGGGLEYIRTELSDYATMTPDDVLAAAHSQAVAKLSQDIADAVRALQRADHIVHSPDIPALILDLARRDATRHVLNGPLEATLAGLAADRTVLVLLPQGTVALSAADTLRSSVVTPHIVQGVNPSHFARH